MDYLNIGTIYILEFFITLSFCNRVLDKKPSYSIALAGIFPLYIIGFAVFVIFRNAPVNACVAFLIYFFTMFIGYNDKLFKKVVYAAYLLIISYVSEFAFIFLFFSKYQVVISQNTLTPNQQLIISIAIKTVNFILVQLLALLIKRNELRTNKKLLPLFLYPIISICFTLYFVYLSAKYDLTKFETNMYLIILLFDAIMCVVIFMYYGFLEEKDREIKELEKEQQFVELNNSYMQVLEHQNNEMRMMFHDTKNHYNAIANMDSAEEIHSYVDALFDDIQKYQIIKLTDNKMLDLLLSKYKAVCSSKNICFNIEVKTANLDYIDDSDLSILVCNLLDNAVESAEQSAEKSIVFSLRRVNTFDVLNVINSCDTEPEIKGKIIKTSKKDKSAHGYGIKIISKYAKKNNAEYEWHYDNEAKKFNSTLIFKR